MLHGPQGYEHEPRGGLSWQPGYFDSESFELLIFELRPPFPFFPRKLPSLHSRLPLTNGEQCSPQLRDRTAIATPNTATYAIR